MTVFVCKEGFENIMSCIYDAWTFAVKEKIGHDNVRIERAESLQQSLFDSYIFTESDAEKAGKITEAIRNKISGTAYIWVYRAAISVFEDAPDAIYRFLLAGFSYGRAVTEMMAEHAVMRIYEINRYVGSETHSFIEFMRFTSVNGILYIGHIEPKNNVAELVAGHFDDRMPSERFIIVDDNRRLAVIHNADEDHYVKYLTDEEYDELSAAEMISDEFTSMWKSFFEAIEIKQRRNRICQQNHFPKWMRKHATEFI